MATETFATLADYSAEMPVDGPSGRPLLDADGRPDDPSDYRVMESREDGNATRLAVVGPSGQRDLVVIDATGARIYRDTDEIA